MNFVVMVLCQIMDDDNVVSCFFFGGAWAQHRRQGRHVGPAKYLCWLGVSCFLFAFFATEYVTFVVITCYLSAMLCYMLYVVCLAVFVEYEYRFA